MLRLPSYIAFYEGKGLLVDSKIADLNRKIEILVSENIHLKESNKVLIDKFSTFDALDNKFTDLQHKFTSAKTTNNSSTKQEVVNATVSDNHEFDNFYRKFEDQFRGSEAVIKERIMEHAPLFEKLSPSLRKKLIVDIGCGRGEFIYIMKDKGFNAVGVDMNREMVERAQSQGLDAVESDAQSYLKTKSTNSLAAITGFHIVEHIPFESLMSIFSECYRTLDRGGFVLFETPNPKSLFVGANTFYLDPSHQRPVPSELLAFMLEYNGFSTEILPLHRLREEATTESEVLNSVHETVFGHADYAVIGKKL